MQNTKARLLVVDDERGPRESLRFLFKDLYEVACVDSVDQALVAIKENPPDCIITDIKMPGKTGIDGLQEIRAIDPDVSIIMLTGFGSIETAQQAIRHGASDYVKKPFDAREMRETVQMHIEKSLVARRQRLAYENLQKLNEQLQQELQDKEPLARLGQASSEFVHDLKNPLTVICGYAGLLMTKLKSAPALNGNASNYDSTIEYLEQLERSVQRCQEMSQTWRELSEDGIAPVKDPVMLDALTQEVVAMLRPIAKQSQAEIKLEITVAGMVVLGNNLQLYRAVQNLVSNAIQALPKDGTGLITLRLSSDDDKACIEIIDNGCGIPPDKLESVFTPYVSTKKQQGGMGLGLFITRRVIEAHGGTIALHNRKNGGLTATVHLPLANT